MERHERRGVQRTLRQAQLYGHLVARHGRLYHPGGGEPLCGPQTSKGDCPFPVVGIPQRQVRDCAGGLARNRGGGTERGRQSLGTTRTFQASTLYSSDESPGGTSSKVGGPAARLFRGAVLRSE